MTEIEQMINTLESVERYLRNQQLSERGRQVKGKVLEALKIVGKLNIDDVRLCFPTDEDIEDTALGIYSILEQENYGTIDEVEAFEEGAKWMRDKISK